jgi:hypothetical protein
MATFYVLPPRECLEQALSTFLARTIPSLPVRTTLWDDFLVLVAQGSDTFFIHREDLPVDGDLHSDLASCFGAESGDVVLEIGLGTATTEPRMRRSIVPPIPERVGSR